MRRWMMLAMVGIGLLASPAAVADDGDDKGPEMRSRVVAHEESGARFERPEGWVTAEPGEGVAALFRAAGDERVQIEVRISPEVDDDESEYFFTSFHSALQKEGFAKREVRKAAEYDGKEGRETEYEMAAGDDAFRLIVWQHHRQSSALLVVGFFPEDARDEYYEDYQQVIEKMTFDD